MRDTLATRIPAEAQPETSSRWTHRLLLHGAILTEQSKAFLAGEMKICLEGAFELYIEARSQGYRSGNHRLDPVSGESWCRCSAPNIESARRAWTRALGNPFFSDIAREDVVPALEEIRNLPKGYGKGRSGADEGGDRSGDNQTSPDRIGVTAFLRIGRMARQIGDFLVELGLASENPFDICCWSAFEEERLRRRERPVDRHDWSEAVECYLSSPIFKGDMGDAGDPLFWIPLLMRLGGLRLDEAVHLTTEDLQFRDGMPVFFIERDTKTPAARREVPVPLQLQDLGLLDLFELRRNQKEALLFPQLAADRPGTATARFRKDLIRYCETHGIDASTLHAHDFRRALHHALLDQECPDHVVRSAMGQMSRDTSGMFLDDSLLQTVQQALSEAGAGLPDIVGPNC